MFWRCFLVLACDTVAALSCRCLSYAEGKDDSFNREIEGLSRSAGGTSKTEVPQPGIRQPDAGK